MRVSNKPRDELWVNFDCRSQSGIPGIAKLWVSLSKQGAAMTTISRRITKIVGGSRLPEMMQEKALEERL